MVKAESLNPFIDQVISNLSPGEAKWNVVVLRLNPFIDQVISNVNVGCSILIFNFFVSIPS